ncbi:MAG: MBL fold metallo-hydrolase [Puniceicoccales bacterium]|jgi:glyoxylase-like metal-dependent hydrolase (beta-lactamase superfamily II)|nr:MBL fold metallo-hydrolase [Puniceicoccales bacterium]
MEITCSPFGPFETNCYLLIDDAGKRCAVVDAPPDSARVLLPEIRARKLELEALLLTHGHWDHMADAHAFVAPGVRVYAHSKDRSCYETPQNFMGFYKMALPHLTAVDFQAVAVTDWMDDGDSFELLGKAFSVRHVPGHCPGNILFYCASEKAAFPGDAIFEGSVGRTDLPGGSWAQLLSSICTRIYTLPDDTALFPGHGSRSTVGREKRANPYARPEADK